MRFRGASGGFRRRIGDGRHGPGDVFLGDVTLVVGDDECRQRQGDYEADEAEQRAPDGEREEDYRRIEAHGLAHDFGCEHHVGDGLHHDEHGCGRGEDYPEVLPRVGGLEQREEEHRDEGQSVHVGYETEYAHEYAEAYCHGEVDDGEADAEQHRDAKRHEALAAYVVVHLALHVADEFVPERAAPLREYFYEAGGQLLVVEQDEEEVEQGDERRDDAYYHAGRLPDYGEHFGHGAAHGLGHVFLLEEVLDAGFVFLYPLLYGYGEIGYVRLLVEIAGENVAKLVKLRYHRRYYEVEHAADDGHEEHERDDD